MSNLGAIIEGIDKWTPKSEADLFKICKEHKDNLAGAFDPNGWTLLHTAVYKEIDFISTEYQFKTQNVQTKSVLLMMVRF